MLINYFDGNPVTLFQMLDTREQRSWRQVQWLERYPQGTLLSMTLNIPGSVKNSPALSQSARQFRDLVLSYIEENPIETLELDQDTGWEFLAIFTLNPHVLKTQLIQMEEAIPSGRVFDLDVLYKEGGDVRGLSRKDLGFQSRKCLLCHEDAKVCGRNRTHSIEELQSVVQEYLQKLKE